MKTIKILSLFMLCFLLQACPNLLDDSPDFYVTIINNSDEKIFYHSRGFEQNQELPENSIVDWDPRINEDSIIMTSDSVNQGINFNGLRVYSFMFYKESTFEENDWETIRDEGLFDARYDLTDDELAEMDYTIEFTGE
ncbi:MAG: hypothetical protein ACQESK_07210 [Bacteroidota bacterium]